VNSDKSGHTAAAAKLSTWTDLFDRLLSQRRLHRSCRAVLALLLLVKDARLIRLALHARLLSILCAVLAASILPGLPGGAPLLPVPLLQLAPLPALTGVPVHQLVLLGACMHGRCAQIRARVLAS
jgi:hypothetical protein